MKNIPEDILNKLKAVTRRIEIAAAFDGIGNEDFNSATSVRRLAEIAGMSERSLRDYFKIFTGKRLVEYISERRAEYAARIFRIFPTISKSEVARVMGFNCPNGIYGLMRKNGVNCIDSLQETIHIKAEALPFRKEKLRDSIMFYRQEEIEYKECSKITFEEENWDAIEHYVESKHRESKLIGYVGYAIDKYLINDKESGIFISGILYQGIQASHLKTDQIGEIGWRFMPERSFAVFTFRGPYDLLDNFYRTIYSFITQTNNLRIDISIPIMEKYLNSPSDTSEEELITELWVPLMD